MPTLLPKQHKVVFSRDVMTTRPILAIAMVQVITRWSEVEHRWGMLLAEILEAEAAAGVAMFNAVANQQIQRRILLAAGRKRLSDKHLQPLTKLIKDAGGQVELRNEIAHGYWCEIVDDPLGIALGDGRYAGMAIASAHAVNRGVESLLGGAQRETEWQRYTLEDFDGSTADAQAIIDRQMTLMHDIRAHRQTMRSMLASIEQ